MGASGAGKIYIGCAFGVAACRQLYKVKYIRLPELLEDLNIVSTSLALAQYYKLFYYKVLKYFIQNK